MNRKNDVSPNDPGRAEENWLRTLHQGLARELLQVLAQSDEEREDNPADLPLEAEALLMDAMRKRATAIHPDSNSSGILVRLRIVGLCIVNSMKGATGF
ncbi:MAG: hypothetical protein SV201_03050 [Pseudomonadota bacterium]|nr:hypothetical protein [Pseudomonadota bacterium]